MEKTSLINEPIFWEGTLENLKKQKFDGKQRISFLCKNCGQLHEICFRRAKKIDKLWCQSCKFKEIRGKGTLRNEQIQAKTRQTNLERYGAEHIFKTPGFVEKSKQTCLEKYGAENYTQTEEYKEKTRKTCQEKYGTDWTHQSKEVIEKGKQTCLERYGVENPSQLPEVKEKMMQTNLERYGVLHATQSKEIQERAKATMRERYGVDYTGQSLELVNKQKNTCLEKYGTYSTSQNHYSESTKEILFDKEKFISFIESQENKDAEYLASLLGINVTTFRKYIHKYDLAEKYLYQTEVSRYEIEIKELLDSLNIEYLHNRKDIIPPLELDIYIPSKNVAIEFDGNYWHSTLVKPLNYHNIKTTECEKKGIRLIHIFEYEWNLNSEKIKNYLRDILDKRNLISAEDCTIKEVSFNQARNFINKHSLKEYQSSSVRIGLFKENELLEIITFSKTKFKEAYDYKISNIARREFWYWKSS